MPASALEQAAQTAATRGKHEGATAEAGPWMFTLDAPSYMAVRMHAKAGGLFRTSTRPTFESTNWVHTSV